MTEEERAASELLAVRTRLGLSVRQMADVLGVSANTINRWELGKPPTRHPRLLLLALERLEAINSSTQSGAAMPSRDSTSDV